MTKKVLILNSFIKNYTGSEIVTLDVSKTLKSMGYELVIAGFDIGKPLISEFEKNDLEISNIYNLSHGAHYDLIWAHHFITLEYCILNKNITANKIIFSSLSPFAALESPPIVLDRISLFLANSLETKSKLESMGIEKNNIFLFPNSVCQEFFTKQKIFSNTKIKKIAIISNHPPVEIMNSLPLLEKSGLSIDIFGKGFIERLITPEMLLKYDSIITIGKSVQYGLSLGIPVYCYDMFGGPGWIQLNNIEKAEEFNFSGRCTNTYKTETEILNDFINYEISLSELDSLRRYSKENYDLKSLIHNILSIENRVNTPSIKALHQIILRQREFYQEQLFGLNYAQLFFSEHIGCFSEENSIRSKIIPDSLNEIIFYPPKNKVNFRFDPANRSALISDLYIEIFYSDSSTEIIRNYTTYNLISDDREHYSLSNDPQIYFESQKNKEINRIKIIFNLDFSQMLDEKITEFSLNKQDLLDKLKVRDKEVNELNININNLNSDIINLNQTKVNLTNKITEGNNRIDYLNAEIKLLEHKNKCHIDELKYQKEIISSLEIMLKDKENKIELIENSKGYKMLKKIKSIIRRQKTDYELLSKSKLFDSEYYLNINDDVKNEKLDPISHFLEFGWKEGRHPSKHFDINFYLAKHSDVKESGANPLVHYIKYGKSEGREIKSLTNSVPLFNTYIKALNLLKANPLLLSKFIFMVKNQGIKQALLKVKNKVFALNQIDSTAEETVKLEDLLGNLSSKNLDKIQNFYVNNPVSIPIDIIIPVYNGYEFLDNLFASIVKNTSLPYRLLIANDKSPDEKVKPFIQEFISKNPNLDITFVDNQENLGFLKTVNLLASYAKNHIVILNTDTEVPNLWLERLMYPILSNSKIASTTPFTNSGTICSFPNYLVDNKEIYENLALEEVDNIFKLVDVDNTMLSIPTGVGFCMGMNFDVIQKIGMFDEIYGKGYAEENDWCQRAIEAGYTNMHITNLFVYHKHGGSFLSEDKIRYINEHYQLLLNKFPTYDAQIQNTIKENKLFGLRALIKALLDFNFVCDKTILMLDHDLGGGANSYRKQEIEKHIEKGNGIILFHYNINLNTYNLSCYVKGNCQTFSIKDEHSILDLLKHIRIDEIFLNGLVSYPKVLDTLKLVLKIKEIKNAKLVFPVHDYFCISPNYTLLDDSNKYTGVPTDMDAHSTFLKNTKHEFKLFCQETNAHYWKSGWGNFLNECEEILCFSHSSEDIMLTAYPNLKDKLVYIPHDISGTFSNIYVENKDRKCKTIGVLGNINLSKGRDIIKEIISHIEQNKLSIRIVLIGNIDAEINSKYFIKTGSYKKEDVPTLIKAYQIDEFLIPSVWPETFSYTTDEIMQLGYPLSVFDLGAPAERVKLYEKGRILKFESYLESLCFGK
ncbi:hypothetical protein A1D22_06400 [Pasteurellaceae bacterium LFhippo2]|nr:hypothetical protein [Pasteurellaceae bacterium LFhippo2]